MLKVLELKELKSKVSAEKIWIKNLPLSMSPINMISPFKVKLLDDFQNILLNSVDTQSISILENQKNYLPQI